MPKSEVFLMDCMEGMKGYTDKYFELAIVDPPYGINEGNRIRSTNGMRNSRHSKTGAIAVVKVDGYKLGDWDKEPPDQEYFNELLRVSKNQIIWGINNFNVQLGSGLIIWDKVNGDNNFSDAEVAYCSFHKSSRLFRYMWNGMMQGDAINSTTQIGNKSNQEKRIHKTQKPVKLYKWLLQNYAKEGDKILDTHLGSGSSRIAAYEMGFDFTGYEIDKDYFEASEKRFQQYKSQLKIF
jgi:site-specific DNA-methyltransferase (adenine-specific)